MSFLKIRGVGLSSPKPRRYGKTLAQMRIVPIENYTHPSGHHIEKGFALMDRERIIAYGETEAELHDLLAQSD
jgi:hypothetical protein